MYKGGLIQRLSLWQDSVVGDYGAGRIISLGQVPDDGDEGVAAAAADAVSTPAGFRLYSYYPPGTDRRRTGRGYGAPRRQLGQLPRVRSLIVGLDVRGYSNRPDEEQVFLALALHVAMTRAEDLLRMGGMLPAQEPLITLERGDGGFLVFSFLEALTSDDVFGSENPRETDDARESRLGNHLPTVVSYAFGFIFALNALVQQANQRRGFRSGGSLTAPREPTDAMRALPIEVRYAISYGDVLPLIDTHRSLNGAGGGIVTCARILATDHGGHLMVQQSLLDALLPSGGLDAICGGKWGHKLHRAELPQTNVKSNTVAYSDIFGFHHDQPLLEALGRTALPPTRYHIGSHDVGVLDR
jgi:hypothetical protein